MEKRACSSTCNQSGSNASAGDEGRAEGGATTTDAGLDAGGAAETEVTTPVTDMDRAAGMSGGRGEVELVVMDNGTGAVLITEGMIVEGVVRGGISGTVSGWIAGESHFSLSSGKLKYTELILLE